MLHVASADLQPVAEVARDCVALLDVEQGLDFLQERPLEARMFQQDVPVRHERHSHEARVEKRRKALDEPARLELLDALVDRWRGKADGFRDSRLRDLGVPLENIEDPAIDLIHIKFGPKARNPNFIWT